MASGIIGKLLFARIPPALSRGERDLLEKLRVEADDVENGEQLTRFVPGGWYFGSDRISATLCFRLIKHCAISMDGEESGGTSYWYINETGREALADPNWKALVR